MGDSLPRRLSVSVAPSLAGSSLGHILPLHEARSAEDRLRGERRDDIHRGVELRPLETNFDHTESSSDEHTPDENEELLEDESSQMPPKHKKSKSRSPNPRTSRRQDSEASALSPVSNGHPPDSAGGSAMNGSFRERSGKHSLAIDTDGNTHRATARLMGRSSFSLDHAPTPLSPTKSIHEDGSKGFWELPEQDRRNFLLLVLLYFLQGIPMGLASGSVPFLLKKYLSFGQIGVYSLASYPYSLKLLWSPIVDAVWSTRLGRRKSWILPIQLMSGVSMLWLGTGAEKMMEQAAADGGAGVWGFTGWWFGLVFLCATQDIAVDGE
jgi:MFS transporter, PAT family, solute carrier family 33 (acetyl-CoA transportor), member 1